MRALSLVLFVIAMLCGASLFGCSEEVKVDQKFVDLYVELRVIEMTYGKDSPMGRLVRQDALKAAGYTREQFFAKTEEILNDERQWVPFQKAVTDRIDTLLAQSSENDDAEEPAPKEPVKKAPPRRGGDD